MSVQERQEKGLDLLAVDHPDGETARAGIVVAARNLRGQKRRRQAEPVLQHELYHLTHAPRSIVPVVKPLKHGSDLGRLVVVHLEASKAPRQRKRIRMKASHGVGAMQLAYRGRACQEPRDTQVDAVLERAP